ncbi:hypothetical protein A1O3_04171 [Capronia epimyces CBS 606.96]|uniref:Major facilitator superfamily (MFS) profile domain-containing protein n=1 Tax=Capronia epimyces CBS 606.96 TaxID=1182542 RepID=W9Y314_9EURO|nr:uncharacterized protein A1O3_04171 [Capronia epimyces CBS 606.96]EXJ87212.1 hypothetical protein A1O3_04171 [Capronia epimyces CBS 606.96]
MAGEKEPLEHMEEAAKDADTAAALVGHALDETNQPRYDDKETIKLMRRVDWRVLPMLTFLYLISFLDRGNIGNAKVAGMNDDLGLTGAQFNMAVTVFFIPYAIFEVPSNIVLKLMRPSWWISIIVTAWGTVMLCQGFVQNYHGLIATRIILGVTEAGFFPAAAYLVTTWYCRFEVQRRMALFYSAASLAGAFSGLLAFGIQHMDGVGNLAGWRWIYILEGILSVLAGLATPFVLPDSPDTAGFLTAAEKATIKFRLEQDSGTAAGKVSTTESFQWKFLWAALFDWKIWFAVFIFWGNTVPLYAFTYTAPSIILELGYTSAQAQLLTIPIYLVGMISTLGCSWLADRRRTRWPFIVIPYSVGVIGFLGLLAIPHPRLPGLTYGWLFFIPAGLYPPVITMASWLGNNLAPTWKRSIGIALGISLANAGGIVGSNIFIAKQAPHYWLGYGFCFGCVCVAILSTLVLRYAYKTANEKRDKLSEEEVRAKYTEQELLDLGDYSPLYRYVL